MIVLKVVLQGWYRLDDLMVCHQSLATKEPVIVVACVGLCSEIGYSFCIIFFGSTQYLYILFE